MKQITDDGKVYVLPINDPTRPFQDGTDRYSPFQENWR